MQAFSVPCWWVSWWLWRAGCISQDTYLLYSNLFVVAFMRIFFLQWSKSLLQDMIVWIVPNDPWMQNRDQLQVRIKSLTKKSEHDYHNLRWPSYLSPLRQLSTSTPAMSQMERRPTKGLNRFNDSYAWEKWVLSKVFVIMIFHHLLQAGSMMRLDPAVWPTKQKCATVGA